jgi:hypothetical protein
MGTAEIGTRWKCLTQRSGCPIRTDIAITARDCMGSRTDHDCEKDKSHDPESNRSPTDRFIARQYAVPDRLKGTIPYLAARDSSDGRYIHLFLLINAIHD